MSKITLPTNYGYYVEWETGETFRWFDGRILPKKETFESRDKAKVDRKIAELKASGYKITNHGDCFF